MHTTPLQKAVAEGLADKIAGKVLDETARQAFIGECRAMAGDAEIYAQEYQCAFVDETTAWLPWDLITKWEREEAGDPQGYQKGPCYVGMDIARRGDLTVIWVVEKVGDVLWTREVISMRYATFAEQLDALAGVFKHYKVQRCCIDQTGMGEAVVEQAQERHGKYALEGVLFTGAVKQGLATVGKQAFEDRLVRIPINRAIRDAHHAVRRTTTLAGNVRFDAERNATIGHADHFWAHMLAIHGASTGEVRYEYHRVAKERGSAWGDDDAWDDDTNALQSITAAGFGMGKGAW